MNRKTGSLFRNTRYMIRLTGSLTSSGSVYLTTRNDTPPPQTTFCRVIFLPPRPGIVSRFSSQNLEIFCIIYSIKMEFKLIIIIPLHLKMNLNIAGLKMCISYICICDTHHANLTCVVFLQMLNFGARALNIYVKLTCSMFKHSTNIDELRRWKFFTLCSHLDINDAIFPTFFQVGI